MGNKAEMQPLPGIIQLGTGLGKIATYLLFGQTLAQALYTAVLNFLKTT